MREPPLVAEHDTWISVDPVIGCPAACDYCYLGDLDLRARRPRTRASVAQTVEAIEQHLRGRTDRTPIAIGNYTDMAMDRGSLAYLVEFAEACASRFPDRPLVVITKSHRVASIADDLAAVGHPVLVFLSHSFARGSGLALERGPIADWRQSLAAITDIARHPSLSAIHFWRPFISDLNPPEELAARVEDLVAAGASSSVVVGFKSRDPARQWWSQGTTAALTPADIARPGSEYFAAASWQELRRIAARLGHVVYRNSSCAVGHALNRAEALRSFDGPDADEFCRSTTCPSDQRSLCDAAARAGWPPDAVATALTGAGRHDGPGEFVVRDGQLVLRGDLAESRANVAVHVSGIPVRGERTLSEKAWLNYRRGTGQE